MGRNDERFSTDSCPTSFTFFSGSDTINYGEPIPPSFLSLFSDHKDEFDWVSAEDLTLEQLDNAAKSLRSWMAKNTLHVSERKNLMESIVRMWYERRDIVGEFGVFNGQNFSRGNG
jgi:hypothetical protein